MIPKNIHDAIVNSPAGKLIDRLITEEVARGGDTSTPGGHGSIAEQLYWTIRDGKKPKDDGPTVFDPPTTPDPF